MAAPRTPVVLTFDLDGAAFCTAWGPGSATLPVVRSMDAFGIRRGAPRLLTLLERHGVPATFFVPGRTAERCPDLVQEIATRGHELGVLGHRCCPPDRCTPAEEREQLNRGVTALARAAGVGPVGYRAPAWEFDHRTMALLREQRFLYSSNFMDDDQPYLHPGGLVELPVQWHLSDAPLAPWLSRSHGWPPAASGGLEEVWREEFLALYAEGKPLLFTLHPQLTGRAGSARLLERLLLLMKGFPEVEFQTGAQVARRVQAQGGWS